jgi:hypothetical protein
MHPQHLPIFVLVEVKDDPMPGNFFVVPLPFDAAAFDELDATIRSVFPEEDLITPDFVRGNRKSVAEAIKKDGWPTLRETRGKILFGLDNGQGKIDIYLTGHPGLAGRVLFTDSPPGSPEAAFAKRNDPIAQQEEITELVKHGFIVRTRADADTLEARPPADTTMRDAAIASGAQYVSTDYPELGPFGTDYIVQLPGNGHDRCNPVNAPKGCRDDALEFFADQRQLVGRKLTIKDPSPERRSISVTAKDTLIETALPGGDGDPTQSGGTLEITNPTTLEETLFTLPAAGWKGLGKPAGVDGWQYRDEQGASGPCTLVDVRNGKSLRAVCSAAKGAIDFTLDEATQGSIDVELRVGGGSDHCLHFGGTIVKDVPGTFVAKSSPAAQCGDGVD